MVSTRRNRKIKKPSLKRKRRTRRNRRKLKGGDPLEACIQKCRTDFPAPPPTPMPTIENPTPNGWYTTDTERGYESATVYSLYSIHDEKEKPLPIYEIPSNAGKRTLRRFFIDDKLDLPVLGKKNTEGEKLIITKEYGGDNKLMWEKDGTTREYLFYYP